MVWSYLQCIYSASTLHVCLTTVIIYPCTPHRHPKYRIPIEYPAHRLEKPDHDRGKTDHRLRQRPGRRPVPDGHGHLGPSADRHAGDLRVETAGKGAGSGRFLRRVGRRGDGNGLRRHLGLGRSHHRVPGRVRCTTGPVADGFRRAGSHRTGRTRPRLRPQPLRHGVPGFGKGPEARDGTGWHRRHDPVLRLSRGRAGGGQGAHGARRRLRRPRRRHHLASRRNEPGLERVVARAQLLQGELPRRGRPRLGHAAPGTQRPRRRDADGRGHELPQGARRTGGPHPQRGHERRGGAERGAGLRPGVVLHPVAETRRGGRDVRTGARHRPKAPR